MAKETLPSLPRRRLGKILVLGHQAQRGSGNVVGTLTGIERGMASREGIQVVAGIEGIVVDRVSGTVGGVGTGMIGTKGGGSLTGTAMGDSAVASGETGAAGIIDREWKCVI